LAKFAAYPTVTINSLASPQFQQLIKSVRLDSPLPASNDSIKKILLNESKAIQEKVALELRQVKGKITLIIDIWTDPLMLHGYIGITAHFIRGSSFKWHCIGVKELIGSHSGENVKKAVEEKLATMGLSFNDIFAIVTDNGSNVIKGFDNFQGNFLTFTKYHFLENDEEIEPEESILTAEDEENDQISEDLTAFSDLIGQRYSCIAHSLQRALYYGVKFP
jgi:hypothetical protein